MIQKLKRMHCWMGYLYLQRIIQKRNFQVRVCFHYRFNITQRRILELLGVSEELYSIERFQILENKI